MMNLPARAFEFVRSEAGYLLREDTLAWAKWYENLPTSPKARPDENIEPHLDHLFTTFAEFRSLFDYRCKKIGGLAGLFSDRLPRATDLHIATEIIGPRFRIQHGYSTHVFAREIGADFWVNHLVTVGSHRGIPIIGDRVAIRTGAVVVGPIEIESDCTVTANAVVTQSMPRRTVAYAPRTIFKAMQ